MWNHVPPPAFGLISHEPMWALIHDCRRIGQWVGGNKTNPRGEVVVPKADSLVGAGVSLDRRDHLLHQQRYEKFFSCLVASVESFLAIHLHKLIIRPRCFVGCGDNQALASFSARIFASIFTVTLACRNR